MKLRDLFIKEFKIAGQPDPKDREDYKAKMASLQDIQKDPRMADARTQATIAKRKAELAKWAEKNLKSEGLDAEPATCTHCNGTGKHGDDECKVCGGRGYVTEDGVQATDLKRMGADTKKVYVHKDGKTIMIPAEKKDEYMAKGYKLSSLRAEDDNSSKGMNKYGLAAKNKDGKFYSYRNGKLTGTFDNMVDLQKHQHDLIKDESIQTEETNEGEMRLDKSAFVQMLADKIKEPQKGHGRPEYDNRLLAKMYKLITGKDVDFEGNKFTITMNKPTTEGTYLDEGWLDTLKAAGRKIVPDQIKALYDPATAAKVQADDQAKVQMDTLFKDINTVAGLNQTDVSKGYPADLVVAYLRKYVSPRHPDAFKRMDAQGDLKKMFPAGQKISSGTLKGNLNKIAIELGKINLSPDQNPAQQITQQPQAVAASIDNEDSVSEGAEMIAYHKHPTEKNLWTFPDAYKDDKEVESPYMSNASMRQFLDALGYNPDFEDQSPVPAKEFIAVTTQWLQKNIDKKSPEEPTTIDKNPDGPTMISGGKPEGYMNRQVKLHNELARKIIAKYPEVTHLGFN